jgi:copper resistance protein C
LVFVRKLAAAFLVALATTLAFGQSPAQAHNVLVGSDPVVASTETSIPEDVKLTFNDPIMVAGAAANQIVVKDPMGMVISSGRAHVAGRVISTVLSPKMIMNGRYTVLFRVVSADGHPVSSSYFFYVSNKPKSMPGTKPITSGSRTLLVQLLGSAIAQKKGLLGAKGSAQFVANFSKKALCYWVSLPAVPGVTALHIHPVNKTLLPSDLIYVPVNTAALKASGSKPFCQAEDRVTMTNLFVNPKRFILMVHTQKFPEGALLGHFKEGVTK